jgi:hypothetical protein
MSAIAKVDETATAADARMVLIFRLLHLVGYVIGSSEATSYIRSGAWMASIYYIMKMWVGRVGSGCFRDLTTFASQVRPLPRLSPFNQVYCTSTSIKYHALDSNCALVLKVPRPSTKATCVQSNSSKECRLGDKSKSHPS